MSYPKYSTYKDSGIPWVGDVPKDWEVNPVLAFANERKVKNTLGEEINVLSLSYGNIIRRDIESNFGLLPESFNTYQIVKSGNIILRLTDLQNDKKSLRVGLAKENGIITSAYLNLDFQRKVIPEYAYYLLHSYDLAKVFYSLGGGVRQSLGYDELRRVPFVCPSTEEQKNIVNFLISETNQTDILINKNEKLISLLKEKRKAVISHALTKGLKPDVPMKDSGIEWLGKIPEHWAVAPLPTQIWYQEGPGIMADDFQDEGVPLLRIKNLAESKVVLDGCNYLDPYKVKKKWDHFRVQKDDLLISASATTGGMASEVDEGSVGSIPYTGIIRIKGRRNKYQKSFIRFFLLSKIFETQIDLFSTGATMQHFGPSHLSQMKALTVPKQEQLEIANFLNQKTTEMNDLISRTQEQLEKLKEHRSALISSAVTGKIDVREWNKKEKAA